MNSITRRIRRLESLLLHSEESLVDVLLERRRRRALAEGRPPEPHRPQGRLVDANGRCPSLADILLKNRKRHV